MRDVGAPLTVAPELVLDLGVALFYRLVWL
ncbi:MAG: hypothetical protein ACI9SB_001687 [Candidatus Azotimanducaceae bacterium]|jgi:hypothetical protein